MPAGVFYFRRERASEDAMTSGGGGKVVPVPRRRYPWARWFDLLRSKGRLVLTRGAHFDTSITGMISQLRNRSRREGLRVSLRPERDDSRLTVILLEDK
jgi:hypothetical protein